MPLRGGLKYEFFKAWGNLSIRWGDDPGVKRPRSSSGSVSSWLFLDGLVSTIARLRFTNQGKYPAERYRRSREFHHYRRQILARNTRNSSVTFLIEATRSERLVDAGQSRVPKSGSHGSVRGAYRKMRPYREKLNTPIGLQQVRRSNGRCCRYPMAHLGCISTCVSTQAEGPAGSQ